MKRIDLNGEWNVASLENELLRDRVPEGFEQLTFSAAVPGSTLNDLIKAGIAPNDVFWRDNAELIQKYENYNWKYFRTFDLDAIPNNPILVFERIDTYCDIFLNGEKLAFLDNGYICHKLPLDGKLKTGENMLEVRFYSPINYTLGKPKLDGAFTTERMYNRRIQCTYGWDWTMRFVTTGIYGDCYIEYPDSEVEIKDAYIYTRNIDGDSASVGFDFELTESSTCGILDFEVIAPSGNIARKYSRFVKEKFFRFSLDIKSPELWYPVGYGERPLYTLQVKCNGTKIFSEKFGIRTIKILQLPDAPGSENHARALELKQTDFSRHYDKNEEFSGFILKVNGVKILCKGANWVPCSPFETEGMEAKITKILTLSAESGVNIIRVWGGGYIEKKHFYSECSRLGILVLQDFFMACGAYPEKEDWFIEQLKREAEYTVRFLRNQPCLAWWHGDNENAVNGSITDTDYRGRDSAYLGLAPSVYALDPYREFLPSSPCGGKTYASNTVGTTHNTQYLSFIFDYMDGADLSDYKEYMAEMAARFISEEPTFGASSLSALRKMMTDDDIFGESEAMWKYHTQSNPGLKKHLFDYYRGLAEKVLGKFENGEDKLFKLQYIQCELIRISMERLYREKWFSSGTVFWMLSDCWPAACGWALIDYYGDPKPALYAYKRASGDIVASISKKNGLKLTVSSVLREECKFEYRFTKIINGAAIPGEWKTASVSPEGKTILPCPDITNEMLIADIRSNGKFIRTFYKNGALNIKKAEDNDIDVIINGDSVTITANTYIQAIGLECNGIPSDNYFTMLPGESVTVDITGDTDGITINAYKLHNQENLHHDI